MKKILTSIMTLAVVGAVSFGATQAFFSDTETSTDNVFQAGSLDLKVDYDCYWNTLPGQGQPNCPWNTSSWTQTDLGVEHKFFNFEDLKPGDYGEGTISLHVLDNDAWGRLVVTNTEDIDNGCTEPETSEDSDCTTPGDTGGNGELDDEVVAVFWLDQGTVPGFQNNGGTNDPGEGDNIWQSGEPIVTATNTSTNSNQDIYNLSGVLSSVYTSSGCTDSDGNTSYENCHGLAEDGRMVGSAVYYFGVAWCYGDITNLSDPSTCNGSSVTNISQSDKLKADFAFEIEQYRNNPNPF